MAIRARLQRHFALAFRVNTAAGLAVLALLAGWSFEGGTRDVAGLCVLLLAQVTAVGAGAWVLRGEVDGPLLAVSLYGNPGLWSLPVTAAVFGPRAAVTIAAYDLLTQPRMALAMRVIRARASVAQGARTALVDYQPVGAAMTGLALGRLVEPPAAAPERVVVLGTVVAATGAVLLGAAWSRGRWLGRGELRLVARLLAVHLTVAPALLLTAALAGVEVPGGAWVLALGPMPAAAVMFARVYGYSQRLAAAALAVSVVLAVVLLPVAEWLGDHLAG